jgi:hypothetical protein
MLRVQGIASRFRSYLPAIEDSRTPDSNTHAVSVTQGGESLLHGKRTSLCRPSLLTKGGMTLPRLCSHQVGVDR